MMGADLSGNVHAVEFGCFHHADAVLRGAVAEMQSRSCLFCQQNVSGHNHILHRIGDALPALGCHVFICVHHASFHHVDILTVGQHRNVQRFGDLHSLPVKSGVHDGFAVLADGGGTGFYHTLNVRKFLASHAFCHGSGLKHVDEAQHFRLIVYIGDPVAFVHDRFRVGHGHNRREAAVGCCLSSRIHGLFIGKAGVTEMYMQIDESRHHITAGSIHDPAVFSGSIRLFLIRILFLYFPNFAVTDPQVIKTISLIYRIQKTAAFDQNIHIHYILPLL